jgi:probable HAF family extracellular repeat protein
MKAILCSVLFVVLSAVLARAQGTYTQIDVPRAKQTYGNGINSAGDVVGSYLDKSDEQHGFLLSGSTFTAIDNPRGGWTYASGINDYGQVVGYGALAFIYDVQSKVFTDIGIGNLLTYPLAINNAGTIPGYVLIYDRKLGYHAAGFERFADGRRQRVGVIGSPTTVPLGISSSGDIVGYAYFQSKTPYSFVFESGKYKIVTFGGTLLGINPQATALVGYYGVSGVTSGFLYQNSTLTTLQFPGSTSTVAIGVNRGGQVVGYFTDGTGHNHGFLWTPPADFVSK